MERSASVLGSRYAVPEIVVGGLVLAAVTSLPNAVAAVYLAARGRGAATLSTALNSNTINIVGGLLLPAVVTSLGRPSSQSVLIAIWNVAMTALVLASAYRNWGLGRLVGVLVIAVYVGFAAAVLMSGYRVSADPRLIAASSVAAAVIAGWLVFGRASGQGPQGATSSSGRAARP
jgi:Ca2+/Na+ antiporter